MYLTLIAPSSSAHALTSWCTVSRSNKFLKIVILHVNISTAVYMITSLNIRMQTWIYLEMYILGSNSTKVYREIQNAKI